MYFSLLHVDGECDGVLPYSTWMERVTVYFSLLHVDGECDGVLVHTPGGWSV